MNTSFNFKKVIFILVLIALIFAGYLFYKDNYTNNLIPAKDSTENALIENNSSSTDINVKNTTENSSASVNTNNQTENNSSKSGYTLEEVAKHNVATDCWSIIDGKVYDLTSFTDKHPGGVDTISQMCGKDGTELFNKVHGGQDKPLRVLSKLYLALYLK